MITICPQCQLPLAVTAADLRIAQGQVRCGRCAAVFNALASLYEPPSGAAERRGGTGGVAESPTGAGTSTDSGTGVDASPGEAGTVVSQAAAELDRAAGASANEPSPITRPPPVDADAVTDADAESDLRRGASALAAPSTDAASAASRSGVPDSTDAFEAQRHQVGPSPDVAAGPHAANRASVAAATATAALSEPDRPPAPASTTQGEPSTDAFRRGRDDPPPRERDWEIDTMTAAELAALVARADRDEPAELASIQIAIDVDSEITVMPSESPRVLATAPRAAVPAELPTAADDGHARSLPRLAAVPADDPQIERARAAVARGRESSLRWLELEPAQPAPGSLAASLGAAAEADFGARTGVGFDRVAANAGPGSDGDAPRSGRDGDGGSADPNDLRSLAAQLQHGTSPERLNLDFDLAPDMVDSPARGTYATGLHLPPPQPPADPALDIAATSARSRIAPAPRWMWAATMVLGLGLAAQLVHLYREELVGTALLQGPLTRLYAAIGRPVAPRWEIGRYEVRQQGVVAEPVAAGTLTVRASIRNGAGRAQPAPLLRVILQDRFGNRIATRDLTPREYGGAAAIAPPPMLAPGQRIDAEVSLLDPGGEAVGFELDVCLRRPDSSVSCANDAPAVHG